MRAFVYLVRSGDGKKHYVGWTTDVRRRLAEHNAGKSSYTARKKQWQLIGFEAVGSVLEAKRREQALKRHPRQMTQFKKRLTNVFRTASGGRGQVVG